MSRVKPTGRSLASFALWGGLGILVYLSSFHLGGRIPASGGLDPSWHAVLEHAAARDMRFGREIVYTFGPLGYLYGTFGTGELMSRRIVFALFWSAVVAVSIVGLARRLLWPAALLFALLFLLLFDFMMAGALVALYTGWRLMERDGPPWAEAGLCLVLSLLSLISFTFLVVFIGTLVLVGAVRVVRGQRRSAARLAWVGPLMLVLLWVGLNQRLHDLPLWMAGGFQIVSGYTEAMSLLPNPVVLVLAVCGGLAFLALAGLQLWPARRQATAWGIGGLLLMHAFLAWKHGFVRADDHVFRFLYLLPLLGCLALGREVAPGLRAWISIQARRPGPRDGESAVGRGQDSGVSGELVSGEWEGRRSPRTDSPLSTNRSPLTPRFVATSLLLSALCALCAAGAYVQSPQLSSPAAIALHAAQRPIVNANIAAHALGALARGELDSLRYPDPKTHPFEETAARLGDQPVDLINFQQGILLAAGLNYRPRPVFQSFAAYTPALQDRNVAFYRSGNRPGHLLFEVVSIDQRFPALDDGPLLPLILHNYQPVMRDGMMLLLEQVTPGFEDVQYRPVHEQVLQLGETLDLSRWNDRPLFARVRVERTVVGRFLKLVFQPLPLVIETQIEGGDWLRHRFVASMAQREFLLSPRLLWTEDAIALWGGSAAGVSGGVVNGDWQGKPPLTTHHSPLTAVRFGMLHEETLPTSMGWGQVHVTVYQSDNFLEHHWQPETFRIGTPWIFSVRPAEIFSAVHVEAVEEDGLPVLMVHAPGRVMLEIPQSSTRLSAGFGIKGEAYARAGRTDGVLFVVEVEQEDGTRRTASERLLRPFEESQDRGVQRLEVELKPADRRIRLITDPGPTGDARYDWSYWADVRIE